MRFRRRLDAEVGPTLGERLIIKTIALSGSVAAVVARRKGALSDLATVLGIPHRRSSSVTSSPTTPQGPDDFDDEQPPVAGTIPVHQPSVYPQHALAWLTRNFQMGVVSSLPRGEDGEIIWELAGPMMFRELPAIKFAVLYTTGVAEDDAELLAKRILNEWHGLEPGAGLEGPVGPSDLKETP